MIMALFFLSEIGETVGLLAEPLVGREVGGLEVGSLVGSVVGDAVHDEGNATGSNTGVDIGVRLIAVFKDGIVGLSDLTKLGPFTGLAVGL
jgi:hypothetical protein